MKVPGIMSTLDCEDDEELQKQSFLMNMQANRLATFIDWPFKKGCSCTPEKMAEAGFYHCPTDQEPDLVRCYMCLKELDGWEPDDDPWKEHRSHSGRCVLLKAKGEDDITLEEFLKQEAARQANRLMKKTEETIKEFENCAKATREQLELLA